MTLTLTAAVIVGLVAPLARAAAWGVPLGLLSTSTILTSFVGASLSSLLIGSAANVLLRAASMTPLELDVTSGAIALLGGGGLLFSSVRRLREIRGLSVLCQRLGDPEDGTAALGALEGLLRKARRRDPTLYASLVLMATGPLTQHSLWAEARGHLQAVDPQALDRAQAVLRNQALATCELQFDDTDAAREAIATIARPAEANVEIWLVAMEALILAVTGDPDGAEAKLGTQETAGNPSLEASHRWVQAHIFAARGRPELARGELQALQEVAGRAGVERMLRPEGPASPFARELLERSE
ncbi:MAG: hypothetical protein AAF436_04700 [Myxococcota bacterium]